MNPVTVTFSKVLSCSLECQNGQPVDDSVHLWGIRTKQAPDRIAYTVLLLHSATRGSTRHTT